LTHPRLLEEPSFTKQNTGGLEVDNDSPSKTAQNLLWSLQQTIATPEGADSTAAPPQRSIAYLEADGVVYWTQSSGFSSKGSPRAIARLGENSVLYRLISGVSDQFPQEARRLLRQRIFTNAPLSPLCQGTLAVVAKRCTAGLTPIAPDRGRLPLQGRKLIEVRPVEERSGAAPAFQLPDQIGSRDPHAASMQLALSLAQTREHGQVSRRYLKDRPVAALLVDAHFKVLAVGLNEAQSNKTLHAEVRLIQNFQRRAIAQSQSPLLPPGARIYTTLQPCRMCAGWIQTCAEDIRSLSIFYAEVDPGPHAQNSSLPAIHFPGACAEPSCLKENSAQKTPQV
jgi:tRNA(Arg) A34 adenosine deaminase TadA